MPTILDQVADAYGDFSGSMAKDPQKPTIRSLFYSLLASIDTITVAAAISSGSVVIYDNAAEMNADLAHSAGVLALVSNDSSDINNGIYVKVGASGVGSWSNSGLVTMGSIRSDIDSIISAYANIATQVAAAEAAAVISQEASEAAGVYAFYQTHAAMIADQGNIPNNRVVEVMVDETRSNGRSRYQMQSGTLVFIFTVSTLEISTLTVSQLQAFGAQLLAANALPGVLMS